MAAAAGLPSVLPTSPLAPPGPQTVVAVAGQPVALPAMDAAGARLYAVDLAQVGAPGDAIAQVDLMVMPPGLLGGMAARWDQATVLLTAFDALAAGVLVTTLTVVFASGAVLQQQVTMPTAAAPALPQSSPGALTLNGFSLTIGDSVVGLGDADDALTIGELPLTIGGTPVLLGT